MRRARNWAVVLLWISACAGSVHAAPYAAMVIDARSGEVLHSRNADTRLHPASLTKMMTLYVVFEAVRRGELSMDTNVRISKFAASEPPSKLGLKPGQSIKLRYLVRAAAVKSGNDAATAIGEAVSGSEAAFARRMNRTAKALGMTRTSFKNAHGLTEAGHLSTARDMTTLGRRLFFDFPEYYNIFSRRTTHAGTKKVANTNRRLLAAYRGADGIKTGYTRAAGFNLVASAQRGEERIIATVFGGRSTASRNARVAELLDLGFQRAPSRVAVRKPAPPKYDSVSGQRAIVAVARSLRPRARPAQEVQIAAIADETAIADAVAAAVTDAILPETTAQPAPAPRPAREPETQEVITRVSTSGGRHWGISLGRYPSRHKAEQVLLKTALVEIGTLDSALRKVVSRAGGYEANFVGLTEETAAMACRRLAARDVSCDTLGPG